MKPLEAREKIIEAGLPIFTPLEFRRLFELSPVRTKRFLETYTQEGLFIRLKNGLYALRDSMPPEEAVANAIYRPSYISLEYALAWHGIIPEMPYTITSVTTRATVSFDVLGKTFSYTRIRKEAYGGYAPLPRGNSVAFIAEPEKALVDYLYFVSLGKKQWNDRFDFLKIDKEKLYGHAKRFGRPGLIKLIEKI